MYTVNYIWSTPDAESLLLYMARVSNPKNQNSNNPRLIRYLIDNKHWSPLEMINLTVEIVTSRSIAQQLLRHRSFSFQEFSQRYAQAEEAFIHEARLQDTTDRQNSLPVEDENLNIWWQTAQQELFTQIFNLYQEALDRGIAKESARFILPGATKTKIYVNGNMRSWIHYILIRNHPHAQKEHRYVAAHVQDIMKVHFPLIVAALGW